MTALALGMAIVFALSWCVAVVAWFYAARHLLPMWAGRLTGGERHKEYSTKARLGLGVFMLAIAAGLAAGAIAYWGSKWGS